MNMQELKSLIYQGEKVDIECKKAELNVPKFAYESYSAFANTKGGYIILGVKEDKSKTDPQDLPKPFKLEGIQRIDDTAVHKAVREAFVNLIIHADYLMDAGTLKIIKRKKCFEFTNPGILKLPMEDIFRGGNSKPRNPHMQMMLRMVGFGDNAGSGFPTILATWQGEGWIEPKLIENTMLNQVTLILKTEDRNVIENVIEITEKRIQELIPAYSKKKVMKAYQIIKMISENSQISIDEMRKALNVTDRTIARYIAELKEYKIIGRMGADNGGSWKILV